MPRASRSKSKKTPAAESSSSSQPAANVSDPAIYFWKPEQEHGYLGQWYPSVFVSTESDGPTSFTYENAEQFMMHRKGLLFAPDSPATAAILETTDPRDIKALGRKIPNFDDDIWKRERMNIVIRGTYLKFIQNEDLKNQLLATGDKELVEASPRDRVWGVGFGAKQAPVKRANWGANLLGKALMEVRERIRKEEENSEIDGK
ncbi:hypothetical protein FRC08_000993 [Ceratobasidium sp. 394]|nr:hypothetical protein FRC08_000993 [Ceratobasidium sp. 394]KAG9102242.1 hypothetical protein FS749_011671 [Ceratobasidium sp. UAMH 11750]